MEITDSFQRSTFLTEYHIQDNKYVIICIENCGQGKEKERI